MRTSSKETSFDVVILGGGPAGLSCAMWCADLGLSAMVVESSERLGGQLHSIHNPITNHLGAMAENGMEMFDIFSRQLENSEFCVSLGVGAESVDTERREVRLADGRTFSGRFLVIATGLSRRRLGIPGEAEFIGRGILESGMKARDSVAGKRVAVIGGGDAAVENTLILAEAGAFVTLIHRRDGFSCQARFLESVQNHGGIRIETGAVVEEICGSGSVESVRVRKLDSDTGELVPVDHVLIRVGFVPNSSLLLEQIDLDDNQYILVDGGLRSSKENVFAIGDVASAVSPTISSAVGQGATVAKIIASE